MNIVLKLFCASMICLHFSLSAAQQKINKQQLIPPEILFYMITQKTGAEICDHHKIPSRLASAMIQRLCEFSCQDAIISNFEEIQALTYKQFGQRFEGIIHQEFVDQFSTIALVSFRKLTPEEWRQLGKTIPHHLLPSTTEIDKLYKKLLSNCVKLVQNDATLLLQIDQFVHKELEKQKEKTVVQDKEILP